MLVAILFSVSYHLSSVQALGDLSGETGSKAQLL